LDEEINFLYKQPAEQEESIAISNELSKNLND
jgi:hypothetical protein